MAGASTVTSRIIRSRYARWSLRLPLRALDPPAGRAALRRHPPAVLPLRWLAAPEGAAGLFRPHVPAVFTAHDLPPRRTAKRAELWRRLLGRFERVVVHS